MNTTMLQSQTQGQIMDEDPPEGFTAIEDVIAEMEKDPVKAEHLRKARIKLAPLIHEAVPDHERYERMMRGEGPPK